MSKNNNNSGSVVSIGFGGLLTIVFIVLKLCGVIGWSWLWVLAPIWIPTAIVVGIIVITVIVALIIGLFKKDK